MLSLLPHQRAGGVATGSPGAVGTVESLAGPQLCLGTSTPHPESSTVRSLAISAEGDLYFDTGDPATGLLAKVAATGQASLISAGIAASEDPHSGKPSGPAASRMATDAAGGVLVATASRILSIARGISTVAGEEPPPAGARFTPGPPGSIPNAKARFGEIMAVTADSSGNILVAERAREKSDLVAIRFVNRSPGPVQLYPGTDRRMVIDPGHTAVIAGGNGDAAVPGARLDSAVPALAVAGSRLYLALYSGGKSAIVALNLGGEPVMANGMAVPAGRVRRIAGGGRAGFNGDAGPAVAARFSRITAMAADESGNLFLADRLNHRIRMVDARGRVTTFAGSGPAGAGNGGFDGNDGPARRARLNAPFDVKIASGAQLYTSDSLNGQIRLVDSSGMMRAVPGKGVGTSFRCSGGRAGSSAGGRRAGRRPISALPADVDTAGTAVLVANRFGAQVKRVGSSGIVHTAAGSGPYVARCGVTVACKVPEDAPAVSAPFRAPTAIAVVRNGFYVLDAGDFRVRFVNLSPGRVSVNGRSVGPRRIVTVAGNGTLGSSGDGGRGLSAQIDPEQADISADYRGNLFLSDPRQRKLRLLNPAGMIEAVSPAADAPAGSGCCEAPQGLAADSAGNLYISETVRPRVWFWNRGGRAMVVHSLSVEADGAVPVAGNGTEGFEGDGGPATGARLTEPVGLAVDRSRNLYVADRGAHNVRRIDAGGRISTVAGTGQGGFNGDGLRAELTWLNEPQSVSLDRCGNLLIADSGNGRIRKLVLVAGCRPSPERPVVPVDGTTQRWAFIVLALGTVLAGYLAARRLRKKPENQAAQ